MLDKNKIIEIIRNVNKENLTGEMVELALEFRGIDGVVYAELDIETGDIEVNFRADFKAKPEVEKGLWIATFDTYNMEEIPDDLPEDLGKLRDEDGDYVVAEFYRRYPEYREYRTEFIEEYDIEDKLKELGVTSTVKLLLRTEELNRANEREDEIEVLDKDTLKDIIGSLDINEISHEAFDKARGYSMSGSIDVDIDARDGEVSIGFSQSGSMTIGYYDTYINLFSIKTGDGIGDDYKYPSDDKNLFTENEHIAYYEELEDRNSRIEDEEEDGEILADYEIKDAVIEKFDLDESELLEEYFKMIDSENVEFLYDIDRVNEQIEELYSHIIENVSE